jgi:hypothetical protein
MTRRRKRRPSGGPCDIRLSAHEIAVLVHVRDRGEPNVREFDDPRILFRLVRRNLLWWVDDEIGLTWSGMGCCGRVHEPVEAVQ